MLERSRKVLVESFIGAIALGWLFAQSILHFVYMFSAPVSSWLTRREYRGLVEHGAMPTGFYFQDVLPELIRSVSLLVFVYLLMRWLYFKPLKKDIIEPQPGQTA